MGTQEVAPSHWGHEYRLAQTEHVVEHQLQHHFSQHAVIPAAAVQLANDFAEGKSCIVLSFEDQLKCQKPFERLAEIRFGLGFQPFNHEVVCLGVHAEMKVGGAVEELLIQGNALLRSRSINPESSFLLGSVPSGTPRLAIEGRIQGICIRHQR